MQEQSVVFNQQQVLSAGEDVTFEWKGGAGYEGDFNAFYPEVLANLNLKSPALYEFLWNTAAALPTGEEIFHTVKASGERFPEVNTLAEELPQAEEMFAFLCKA